jgi:hypothetical protein
MRKPGSQEDKDSSRRQRLVKKTKTCLVKKQGPTVECKSLAHKKTKSSQEDKDFSGQLANRTEMAQTRTEMVSVIKLSRLALAMATDNSFVAWDNFREQCRQMEGVFKLHTFV